MAENEVGLRVQHLRKNFRGGNVLACDDVNFAIERGELLVLLGPSGCGKTTTLRCIAGLERPDNDDAIWLNGRNITRMPPKDRDLAFVFQDTALFPHLDVRRNISFGLDMRKRLSPSAIAHRVETAAKLLRVDHLLERRAHEISGGQGQRVALGRAIVMEPAAFLLDEPLANLDAALRVEMRTEIKLIQRKLNSMMIFVTHDQEEALTLGDKIAVMKEGVVQQLDTPRNIYRRPANLFVGTFIGSPPINQFDCALESRSDKLYLICAHFDLALPSAIAQALSATHIDRLILGIRPEFIEIDPRGSWTGQVKLTELLGSRTLVHADVNGAQVKLLMQGGAPVAEGERLPLSVLLANAFYFDENGKNLLKETV
ncbi:MAG: ABC transporter ATP-binding protein [Gammaproteobacteria bacterium]